MNDQQDSPARRKGGRKRKDAGALRRHWIGFKGSDEQAASARERASDAGFRTVSDFFRESFETAGAPARRTPAYDPAVVAQLRRLGNNVNQTLREARFGNFPPPVADAAEDALREVSAYLRTLLHGSER